MKLPFDQAFQEKLMRLLLTDPSFFLATYTFLQADNFFYTEDRELFKLVSKLVSTLQVFPSWLILKTEVKKMETRTRLLARLKEIQAIKVLEAEKRYILNEICRFAKRQNWVANMNRLLPILKEGDIPRFEQELLKGLNYANPDNMDLGWGFLTDLKRRFVIASDNHRRPIRTLIPELDEYLLGSGIHEGEVGVVLARSQVGKTFFLQYMNRSALIQRITSVHINLDMSEDILIKRFDASLTAIATKELDEYRVARLNRLTKLGKIYFDNQKELLYVKSFPMYSLTVKALDSYLERLAQMDFFPRLVVIDYADIMMARGDSEGRNSWDRYVAIGDVYAQLKALAQKRQLAIWTASQSNRESYTKPVIDLEDIAESMQKVHHSDIVIALCQTPKEAKDERLRLFIAKNRNFLSRVIIPIQTNYDYGCFYKRS